VSLEAKILYHFEFHRGELLTPGKIALDLHLNPDSVRKALTRLYRQGKIVRKRYGHYSTPKTAEELDHTYVDQDPELFYGDLYIHGLKLEYRGPLCLTFYTQPYLAHTAVNTRRHRRNRSITSNEEWQDRAISITTNKTLLEIFLRCSSSPLSFDAFREYTQYIQGRFPTIKPCEWAVVQHDFGIADTPLLSLQGIERTSLHVFKNLWLTMYNNAGKFRLEGNFVHKSLSLPDCLQAYQMFLKSYKDILIK